MAELSLPPIVPIDAAHQADGVSTVICDARAYLDGRLGSDAYAEGHIPGARHLDLEADFSGEPGPGIGRHPLPEAEVFSAALAGAGIGPDTAVLAYDDAGGMIAGRLVWMLRTLGQKAALLDGGLDAWTGTLETSAPHFDPVPCPVRHFPAQATVEADEVEAFIASGGVVVDVRGPDRFEGTTEPIDPEAGHIDGAINMPFTDNLDAGKYRPIDDLAAEYTAQNISDETIYYCGSGVSACHTMLAAEAAGLGLGRLYVGSWSGYCTRP